ncbi:hypothetical protein HNR60_001367 [Rhodopseudomonas rhenobacensis]|uniref:Uncharacterized protein n=1 Tax=Rhodopseudomonas rhenobacensis TaxID=87461 RepID=A0A7W7Z2C3_9BRAD|nr:hypothetical protein [Rhodopseudomonas rhenobacensis]MBB5046619.1 hypothetical protein [Rhodopseudomonas rhenobacensis]
MRGGAETRRGQGKLGSLMDADAKLHRSARDPHLPDSDMDERSKWRCTSKGDPRPRLRRCME